MEIKKLEIKPEIEEEEVVKEEEEVKQSHPSFLQEVKAAHMDKEGAPRPASAESFVEKPASISNASEYIREVKSAVSS
ncbi:hypothetical protein L596_001900 [Steinernema carpocapsae]|uniref:Uncharacterized protein n=1 Tax=Steinernema carpocapsae TaxID=34508 RepID=A0A4V6YSU3_STECR|nr:hypothetical protein L596_001900 [Steinernema carpocapsae]